MKYTILSTGFRKDNIDKNKNLVVNFPQGAHFMKKILLVLLFFSFNIFIFCQDNRIEYIFDFIGMDIIQLQENIPVIIQKNSRWDYHAENYPEGSNTIFFFVNNKVKSILVYTNLRNNTPEETRNYFNEFINKINDVYGKPIRINENSTIIYWNRVAIALMGNSIYEKYE
jgi:hypothetical protein